MARGAGPGEPAGEPWRRGSAGAAALRRPVPCAQWVEVPLAPQDREEVTAKLRTLWQIDNDVHLVGAKKEECIVV